MKKEKSPILVVSCIILLFLPIVLPPVFRTIIPDDSKNENIPTIQNKISILQCSRIFVSDLYKVSVKVKYLNDVINSNTITYNKLDTIEEDYQENEVIIPVSVLEEYGYLSQLSGIEIKGEEPNPILVLTEKTITDNSSDDVLKLYFQEDISNQKSFYEQRGYSCNIIES